jgi:hypothetical protein
MFCAGETRKPEAVRGGFTLTKLILTTLVLLALLIGGGIGLKTMIAGKSQNRGTTGYEAAKKGTLQWRADKAIKEGKGAVILPAPLVEYIGGADDPEFVLSNYSVVIAHPIQSMAVVVDDDESIVTWYKFKKQESIQERPALPNIPQPTINPPQALLPVKEDEFLTVTYGGAVNVKGVNITMANSQMPSFANGKSYLLFISYTPSGVAHLRGGPLGIFDVSADGSIEPTAEVNNQDKDFLKSSFGNTVASLKERLAKVKKR